VHETRRVITTDAYCIGLAAITAPEALRVAGELERRAIQRPDQPTARLSKPPLSIIASRSFGSCPAYRLLYTYDDHTVVLLWIGPVPETPLLGSRSQPPGTPRGRGRRGNA
jgi:hypothetical protein